MPHRVQDGGDSAGSAVAIVADSGGLPTVAGLTAPGLSLWGAAHA